MKAKIVGIMVVVMMVMSVALIGAQEKSELETPKPGLYLSTTEQYLVKNGNVEPVPQKDTELFRIRVKELVSDVVVKWDYDRNGSLSNNFTNFYTYSVETDGSATGIYWTQNYTTDGQHKQMQYQMYYDVANDDFWLMMKGDDLPGTVAIVLTYKGQ